MKVNPEVFAWRQRHLHGPDWRRQRAEAAAAGAGPAADPPDPQLLDLCAYLRLRRAGPDGAGRAARAFPHVAAAEALAADAAACRQAKVLALGGCPPGEMAGRLGLDPAALAAWEALFFDVRPARAAADWILAQVIRPERERGDGHLAAQLTFACAGGPVAARAALDAEARVALGQGQTLLDQKVRLHLKFAEAASLPLTTDRAKLFFMKTHADLLYREKRLRLAERRLEQRCAEALRKQRSAEARLELRRRRERERAARQAEKASRRAARRAREARRRFDALARAAARQARRQAARQRAATSALAGLRWEFAAPAGAGGEPLGSTPLGVPEGRCPQPEGPYPPGGGAPAAGDEGVDRSAAGGAPAAPAQQRCVA